MGLEKRERVVRCRRGQAQSDLARMVGGKRAEVLAPHHGGRRDDAVVPTGEAVKDAVGDDQRGVDRDVGALACVAVVRGAPGLGDGLVLWKPSRDGGWGELLESVVGMGER